MTEQRGLVERIREYSTQLETEIQKSEANQRGIDSQAHFPGQSQQIDRLTQRISALGYARNELCRLVPEVLSLAIAEK